MNNHTELAKIEQRDKAEEKRINEELAKVKLTSPKISELKTLEEFMNETKGV